MLDKLFLQVLNMSYTASYVILFILLARIALQKAPKVFSYALWSAALFRLICPWSFHSSLSLLAIGGRAREEFMRFPEPYVAPKAFHGAVSTEGNAFIPAGAPVSDAVSSVPPVSPAAAPVVFSIPSEPLLQNIFTLAWLAGIAALLIYSIVALFRLKKQLRDTVHDTGNIYFSRHLSTPFVMGVLRPKIYLPESLSEVERKYIILHEQTHIRRFDHVIKLVSFLVVCIHWFNPLVWLAFFFSGRDMEMSCDEAVIKKLGSDVKKEYSCSLLSLSTGRRIIGGTPLAFGEGDAKSRIKNILNYKRPAFWMIAAGLLAVTVICIGLATNPKSAEGSGYAENLWQYRTSYIGNNSSVGNIISALDFPDGVVYDGFELYTKERPYAVTVNFKTDTETRNYYTGALHETPFQINACILFSLIENAEYVSFSLDDGVYEPYSMQYTADWAESIVGADLWEESKSLNRFEKLLTRINDHVHSAIAPIQEVTQASQQRLTFFVKPDEPARVIGETAAIIWLKSYKGENTPPVERIADYKINEVTVISGTPKEGQTRQDMKYHYVVRINYDITTASDEYFAPGDGVSGKGTFKGLFRELCVKDLGGGNFDILSAGTGGGEQEFADALERSVSKAILEHNQGKGQKPAGDFACESHVTLAVESTGAEGAAGTEGGAAGTEGGAAGTEGGAAGPAEKADGTETVTVYAMVLYQQYQYTSDGLSNVGGSHIPAAITFDVSEAGAYTLKEYWNPRDGSYYGPDIKAKFPSKIQEDAMNTQKYILPQIQNCYAQAIEYRKLDTAPFIGKLFAAIMSSPVQSSNPGDYLAEHRLDYRELTYYGDYTLRYVFSEFLKGGQTGLKGHLMRTAMDDLIGEEALDMAANNGQEYFDAWREHGQSELLSIGIDAMRERYPKFYLMLTMLSDGN